jgi:hypothetical protein
MLVSYAAGAFLRWDHLAFATAGFLAIFCPLTFLIPESPVYLVTNNRYEEAEKSLQWLRGRDYDVARELKDLQENMCEAEVN